MHCSSLGEFEQGRPVLELLNNTGKFYIILTFFSPSGYEIRKNYDGADVVYYLPADTRSNAKQFLALIQPDIALFVKYDLWFNYLKALQERKIPIVLFSALFREGQYFFRPYGKYFTRVLKGFEQVFVQNEESGALLKRQGFENVRVSGDTRIDRVVKIASENKNFPWLERFASGHKLMVAGSTWKEDEALLLKVFDRKRCENWKLLIAPHDIQNKNIERLVKQIKLPYLRYSELEEEGQLAQSNILIVDNVGMLNQLYRYAYLTYIGGGFGAGIHNTLEPIAFKKPVVFGPKHGRFEEAKALVASGGGFSIKNSEELKKAIDKLSNKEYWQIASDKAYRYIEKNQGASQQVFDKLITLLQEG